MNKIQEYLKSQGYSLVESGYSDTIDQWLHWYQGYLESFHRYSVTVNNTTRQLKRYTLGMAKTVCEDYATLLLNERVQLTAKAFDELPGILTDNAFYDRCNRLMELTMALGTGALVEFLSSDGKPVIDYIRGDMIFPLSWDGDKITECAFGSRTIFGSGKDAKQGYYIQIHTKADKGHHVANVALDDAGGVISLPKGVKPQTGPTQAPCFQILRPAIVNSVDLNNPMGMSVYGACIDQLKACDLVYDSYVNEFILGKKRLMMPQKLAQILLAEDGTMKPVFDPNDVLIYVYQQDEDGKNDPKELDFSLRCTEHEVGLQRMMDLLSKKCGLGVGRYRFDNTGVPAKTANELIRDLGTVFLATGNHDDNYYGTGQLTNDEIHSVLHLKYDEQVSWSGLDSNDFYFDDDAKKIRVLVMDTHGLSASTEISDEHLTWVANTVLSIGTGWSLIVFSHKFLGDYGDPMLPTSDPDTAMVGLLTAWQNGSTYTNATYSLDVDYSGSHGTILGWITGHFHYDDYNIINGVPFIAMTCFANLFRVPETGDRDYDGMAAATGTINEHAVTVISIDPDNAKLYSARIGRGVDRIFNSGQTAVAIAGNGVLTSIFASVSSWASSDTDVATVSGGTVHGEDTGTALITAEDADGNIEVWQVIVS